MMIITIMIIMAIMTMIMTMMILITMIINDNLCSSRQDATLAHDAGAQDRKLDTREAT